MDLRERKGMDPGRAQFQSQTLRVLFTKPTSDDGLWVGQCLDYYIVVQAKSLPDAHYALQKAIVGRIFWAEIRGIKDPFQGVPSAPEDLWKLYETEGTRLELRFGTFHKPRHGAAPFIPLEARVA